MLKVKLPKLMRKPDRPYTQMIDVLTCITESTYENSSLTSKLQNEFIDKEPLPQWHKVIALLKSDSIFWHSIGISGGRLTLGIMHQIMCSS